MFMKLLSFSLIILCCGYIGLAKQHCYKNRVNQLLLCEKLLVNIKSIIKSGNATTKTIFALLSKNPCFDELTFIKSTSLLLLENNDFPTIFREELDICAYRLDLSLTDLLPLYSLCDLIGSCETEEVLQGIDFAIINLKNLQDDAKKTLETTGYLSGKLGFLIGFLICILIV